MTNKLVIKLCVAFFLAPVVSCYGLGSGTAAQSPVSFQNPVVLTRGSAASVMPVYADDRRPFKCEATPSLPEGLFLDPTCRISGTPVEPSQKTTYTISLRMEDQANTGLSSSSSTQTATDFQTSLDLEVAPAKLYISAFGSQGSFYECDIDGKQCRQIIPAQNGPVSSDFGYSVSANRYGVFTTALSEKAVYLCPFPVQPTTCKKLDIPLVKNTHYVESVFANVTPLSPRTDFLYIVGSTIDSTQVYGCYPDGTQCNLWNTLKGIQSLGTQIFVKTVKTSYSLETNAFITNQFDNKIEKCDFSANKCSTIDQSDDSFGASLFVTDNALYVGDENATIPGMGNNTGAIYKCNTDGKKCELLPTLFKNPLSEKAAFGSSIAIYNGDIYSVSLGENKIFKCSLSSGVCSEFITNDTLGVSSMTPFNFTLVFF